MIRSRRRTLEIQVQKGGAVIVRAPLLLSPLKIRRFVEEREDWILRQRKKQELEQEAMKEARENGAFIGPEEQKLLLSEAKRVIPMRVAYYAPLVGVDYGTIRFRRMKSRWGSCSAQGNLCFNTLLMKAPIEVIDSVVVHELCHRLYMDHSAAFYREVKRVYPDYDRWHKWLKKPEVKVWFYDGKEDLF